MRHGDGLFHPVESWARVALMEGETEAQAEAIWLLTTLPPPARPLLCVPPPPRHISKGT